MKNLHHFYFWNIFALSMMGVSPLLSMGSTSSTSSTEHPAPNTRTSDEIVAQIVAEKKAEFENPERLSLTEEASQARTKLIQDYKRDRQRIDDEMFIKQAQLRRTARGGGAPRMLSTEEEEKYDAELQKIRKQASHEMESLTRKKNEQEALLEKQRTRVNEPFLAAVQESFPLLEALIPTLQTEWPKYTVTGNISYTMSVDEIKKHLSDTFNAMLLNGQIITREEFDQRSDKSTWFDKGTKLTRVWGANYLAQRGLKVPRYLLVIDDSLETLRVRIVLGECDPIASELLNGQLYAETIHGTGAASWIHFDAKGTGYSDTSDVKNILRTPQGEDYCIDTEHKSFYDGNPWRDQTTKGLRNWWGYEKIKEFGGTVFGCDYLKRRFLLVNGLRAQGGHTPHRIDLDIPIHR